MTQSNAYQVRKRRSDVGSRRSEYTRKPCSFCGSFVVRRSSEVLANVYCNRECYHDFLRSTKAPKQPGRPIDPSTKLYTTPWGKKPGYKTPEGYIYVTVPEHPYANSARRYGYHRIVMERVLGRYLTADENVHHKNGIKSDNRRANLELWTRSQPSGTRVRDKLEWAREFCKRYEGVELDGI